MREHLDMGIFDERPFTRSEAFRFVGDQKGVEGAQSNCLSVLKRYAPRSAEYYALQIVFRESVLRGMQELIPGLDISGIEMRVNKADDKLRCDILGKSSNDLKLRIRSVVESRREQYEAMLLDQEEEAEDDEQVTTSDAADVDPIDDFVRIFLHEMGIFEPLSREREIEIAKRIEAGRNTVLGAL
jgi:Sigma-70 factor, region 1.2